MFITKPTELFDKIIKEYPEKNPSIIITKTNYDLLKFVEIHQKCPNVHICIIGKDKIHVSEHILGFTWFEDCFAFARGFNNCGIYIILSLSEKCETIEWLTINKENSDLEVSDRIKSSFS